MAFDINYVRSNQGLLKLLSLVLIFVDLILARFGQGGNPIHPGDLDVTWLVYVTVGGFVIIHCIFFFFLLFGEGMATRMEATFLLVGGVLFLASGGTVINTWADRRAGDQKSAGIALGCLLLVTGIVISLDFGFQMKKVMKK